jgi:hypothetical protein
MNFVMPYMQPCIGRSIERGAGCCNLDAQEKPIARQSVHLQFKVSRNKLLKSCLVHKLQISQGEQHSFRTNSQLTDSTAGLLILEMILAEFAGSDEYQPTCSQNRLT